MINPAQLDLAIKNVLSNPDGRYLFQCLFQILPVNEMSFSSDALRMAFEEGRRSAGNDVRNLLSRSQYLDLLKDIDTGAENVRYS